MDPDHELVAPIYQQIGKIIRHRIESGELRPGQPIPSEQALVKEFGVARETVRRAVAWLREQGIVHTVPQRGSFVTVDGAAVDPPVWSTGDEAPAYLRIATHVKKRIDAGLLKPGRPIPSEKQLCQEFEVSRVTARKAVEYLRELGLVHTVPRRGSYVAPRQDETG
ncbi:hypothetical protein Acsp04_23750 [Actinomadura sp. NBRC 104425]|uniref:GntR family transcriptional regulator n=1 Tax=Actinomadura sp. NBRC 104425 TaxID=3032204 RepID=UPI0024A240E0|nr:winged helix-turn-helix domain-containing protein [Actinomadura sp. NBRC 104425]GLZ12140.1 hypothetical protein Acsp04_23750 [Actinomadura sp. NBRC 104425]